jgi:hypothetical protein
MSDIPADTLLSACVALALMIVSIYWIYFGDHN